MFSPPPLLFVWKIFLAPWGPPPPPALSGFYSQLQRDVLLLPKINHTFPPPPFAASRVPAISSLKTWTGARMRTRVSPSRDSVKKIKKLSGLCIPYESYIYHSDDMNCKNKAHIHISSDSLNSIDLPRRPSNKCAGWKG